LNEQALRPSRPSQVSWCKLEVEVEGHKAVGPLSAEGPPRDAPPLTVAALHVQTAVAPGSAANEVVAASVVYLQGVRSDGPMAQVGSRGGRGRGDGTRGKASGGRRRAVVRCGTTRPSANQNGEGSWFTGLLAALGRCSGPG
jgi:hypothetical protein